MRDLDALQKRESEQQQLVEGIVQSLHALTHENKNHVKVFLRVSLCTLETLGGQEYPRTHLGMDEFNRYVNEPIEKFTKDRAERKLLRLRVLDKILDPVRAQIEREYSSQQLQAEVAEKESVTS